MPDLSRSFEKSWMHDWLFAIATLRPVDQSVAIWLAYLADDDGNLNQYTWDELAHLSGLRPQSVRKMMRPDGNSDLSSVGLVERHVRKVGGAYAMPKFVLRIDRAHTMARAWEHANAGIEVTA